MLVSVAVILLTLSLLTVGFLLASPQKALASVSEALNDLAVVAADQPAEFVGTANAYRYLKSEEMNLVISIGKNNQKFAALVPKTREFWIAQNGAGRIRETANSPVFLGERDRLSWQSAGSPDLTTTMNKDFDPGGLSYEDFSRLSANPDELAVMIRNHADNPSGLPVNVGMFVLVGNYLRQPGAPPGVRSALYKVAAKIDGIELIGNVTDRLGRQGVALAMTTEHWGGKQRLTLIFDPTTSAFLEEQKILLEPVGWVDAKPPVVIGYTTYLESGIGTSLP